LSMHLTPTPRGRATRTEKEAYTPGSPCRLRRLPAHARCLAREHKSDAPSCWHTVSRSLATRLQPPRLSVHTKGGKHLDKRKIPSRRGRRDSSHYAKKEGHVYQSTRTEKEAYTPGSPCRLRGLPAHTRWLARSKRKRRIPKHLGYASPLTQATGPHSVFRSLAREHNSDAPGCRPKPTRQKRLLLLPLRQEEGRRGPRRRPTPSASGEFLAMHVKP